MLHVIMSAAIVLAPAAGKTPTPTVPLFYDELEKMDGQVQIQPGVIGRAESLVRAYADQESFRELHLAGAKPQHRSLVARPARRQATTAAAAATGAAAPGSAPSPAPPGDAGILESTPEPVAKLEGHFRSAEMTIYVQAGSNQFILCPTESYSPICRRVMVERTGGPVWQLSSARVVAKRGYELEGFDFSGPECDAFTLQSALEPPDPNGTVYVKFSLGRNPKWDPERDADCAMTLYEIPKPAAG